MNAQLELPADLQDRVISEAQRRGLLPVGLLARLVEDGLDDLPRPEAEDHEQKGLNAMFGDAPTPSPTPSVADVLAGHIGTVRSGRGDLSQNTGKAFARMMQKKREAGRL